ncbi:hypothetical protein FACS1894217_01020 [Clostridia bacterium]|nr:hypothetical protein FACS1894217_01020 [Clostridia bacterium]
MYASALREEDVMTDYQFKSIIKMVIDVAQETNDVAKIIGKLNALLPESERFNPTNEKAQPKG